MACHSNINYLVPVLDLRTPPPPPHTQKILATGLLWLIEHNDSLLYVKQIDAVLCTKMFLIELSSTKTHTNPLEKIAARPLLQNTRYFTYVPCLKFSTGMYAMCVDNNFMVSELCVKFICNGV